VNDLLQDPAPGQVGRLASRGVLFLLLRYGALQLAALAANIILSRRLSPAAFGVYAVALALLVLMTWLSDFGLGAALLQKRELVSGQDLRTVFTVQQLLLAVIVVVILVASPSIADLYHLGADGPWFVRAVAIAGFLASLRTVPSVVMERKLRYGRLTIVEVVDVLVFQVTAVSLALLGLGTWSFIGAMLASKLAGTAISYALAGWWPGVGVARGALRGLFWFALPFQLTWLTYLFRDYLIPILGGLLVGTLEVGYLNWALALSAVPGQMAQVVGRVSFPTLSRMQSDSRQMARALETSVRALFLVAVPIELALMVLAPWLIHLVFSDKWLPALFPLYLLSLNWIAANITSPVVSALNAAGRIRDTLVLNLIWTAGAVLLAWLFVRLFGYVGMAVAYAAARLLATAATVLMVKRAAPVHLWAPIRFPLLAATLAAAIGLLGTRLLQPTLFDLGLVGFAMALVYVAVLWLSEGARLRSDLEVLMAQIRPPAAAS
jgi:O-antigen/teichoic acid export membrane protein